MSNTFGMSAVGHTHTPEDIKGLKKIPEKTSELENDAGFVCGAGIKKIVRVTELPEDAAEHPDTWYIIVDTEG